MIFSQNKNIAFVRPEPGEKIMESLQKAFMKTKWKNAVILCGIGQAKNCEVGFYDGKKKQYFFTKYGEALEIISMQGNIAATKEEEIVVHCHACLSDEKNQCIAGHFKEGVVTVACEMFLLDASKLNLYRKMDATGIRMLFAGK